MVWLTLCAVTTVAAVCSAPLDLVTQQSDPNGYPLNPVWEYQSQNPSASTTQHNLLKAENVCNKFREQNSKPDFSGCTSYDKLSIDERPRDALFPPLAFACNNTFRLVDGVEDLRLWSVHGHINWMPVTYEGLLRFANFAPDGDVDFMLEPDDHYSGLLAGNRTHDNDGISVEINRVEVFPRLSSSAMWFNLPRLLRTENSPLNHPLRTIVVGQFGIDTKHLAHTELHPVYGLAIQTERDDGHSQRIFWDLFARNWGYEGACSSALHILNSASTPRAASSLAFNLRATWNAGSYTLDSSKTAGTMLDGNLSWTINHVKDGLLVTASLQKPDERSIAWLHLELIPPKSAALRG